MDTSNILLILAVVIGLGAVVAIIKGMLKLAGLIAIICGVVFFGSQTTEYFENQWNNIKNMSLSDVSVKDAVNTVSNIDLSNIDKLVDTDFTKILQKKEKGATLELGELDALGRSTYAHIILKDEDEPKEKRNAKINVDPAGWKNFKINGNWANNRCHLIGYQFSGLNDELRNLMTGTQYLNTGSERGTDESNPDGMLYYEQKLDKWLRNNPTYSLDYYVEPIYDGENLTPSAVLMRWVGIDDKGDYISIPLNGHDKAKDHFQVVVLENKSPSYVINYETGEVKAK